MNKKALTLAYLFWLGIQISAQEIKHDVSVTVKLIQVNVMDKAGNPVTDLKQQDFVIHDNGKLKKITEFEKYILSPLIEAAESGAATKKIAPPFPTETDMNRKFFLFFDLANNSAKGFLKAQEAALHFIDQQIKSSDEVGVLSFSVLRGLTLHEYLTRDHQSIRKVVAELGKEGMVGRAAKFEALIWRELAGESGLDASLESSGIKNWNPAHLGGGGLSYEKTSNLRSLREEQKSISRHLISKLTGLSKALRYISGQKHILFFSSGIPYSLIHGIQTYVPARMKEFTNVDTFLKLQFEAMLKELSSANVSIFSINTEAMITDMNVPESVKGEATLRRISSYTGGKFLGNVQNYSDALERLQIFTGSYYVLGYYVDESFDGRYHSIKVDVQRPGCKVFSQRGYFNPIHFSKYSEMEKELHLIDLALTEKSLLQAPIPLSMTAIPCRIEDNPWVMLMARIPADEIQNSIGEKAEIYFLVFDEKEDLIDLKRRTVRTSTLKGKEAYYYSLLPAASGAYQFRIVIRDMDTGKGAVGRCGAEIPIMSGQDFMVFPPLLLNPGKSGLLVDAYRHKSLPEKASLLDYFPFDPAQHAPILDELSCDSGTIQAVLRCSLRNLERPMLKFRAALIAGTSGRYTNLPLKILSGNKDEETGTLLAELQMPHMAPGDYTLLISAEDKTSGAVTQTSVNLKIHDR